METMTNQITVRGELAQLPYFSHENHGKRFFRFFLDVPRLSGAVDRLPVVAEERLLAELDPSGGGQLWIRGQVRSHNSRLPGPKLLVFLFAQEIKVCDGPAENDVHLQGVLCRLPVYRRTPLGREICDVLLAVPRSFHRTDYLPCILWGRLARDYCQLIPGDTLVLSGRLQSRTYRKRTPLGEEERVTYEVSALTAHPLEEAPQTSDDNCE